MLLPKMPPVFGRKVELWKRRAKVVDSNVEHHKPTHSDNNNNVDQPLVCPNSPSFKFYIRPSVRENKNEGKSNCDMEINTKAAGNLESQASISQESKRKMNGEAKRVRKWGKPCCQNLCFHGD